MDTIVRMLTSIRRLDTAVTLEEPAMITFSEDGVEKHSLVNKTAKYQVYDLIGVKPKLSADLYSTDNEVWEELISKHADPLHTDVPLILWNDSLIGIYGTNPDDDYGDLEENISNFISDIYGLHDSGFTVDSVLDSSGCFKIVIKSALINEMTAVIMCTLDFRNGYYAVHSGFITDHNEIILYSTPVVATPLIEEFFFNYSAITSEMATQVKMLQSNLISPYDTSATMSVGEVLWAIKRIGTQIIPDEMGACMSISSMNPDDSTKIVSYLNAFNMPYKSLRKLHHLRKSLRDTHMTVGEMLSIMNSELMNPDLTVSAWTISDMSGLFRGAGDQAIIKSELERH